MSAYRSTILNALGKLVPITPGELGGVDGDFGLRKVGSSRVYSSFSIGGFPARANGLLLLRDRKRKCLPFQFLISDLREADERGSSARAAPRRHLELSRQPDTLLRH